MAASDLKAEVQTRIDALVYSSGTLQAAEVMQGAIDAFGLDCDLTNITSVYNSMEAAVIGGTPADNITALNVTSIALGITSNDSGSGGDTSQIIGSLKTLHVDDVDGLFTAPNGDEWLKTGVIETNASMYPDAKNSAPASVQIGGVYIDDFSVSAQMGSITGVCWDGTHYWTVDTSNDTVFKYTESWVYTGTSFSVSAHASCRDIEWDGTSFWLLSDNFSVIAQYDSTGTYTGISYDVSEAGNPRGFCFDGEFFWITNITADTVHKYAFDGTYQNISFSLASEDLSPFSVTWDGFYFYMTGQTNDKAYRYSSNWAYTGESFSVGSGSPRGICFDGDRLVIADSNVEEVYRYTGFEPFVGGVYTGDNFSTSSQSANSVGICWDGAHYWVIGSTVDTAFKYTAAGVYTGDSFSFSSEISIGQDITWDGTYFWILSTQDIIYRYTSSGVYDAFNFYTGAQDSRSDGVCYLLGFLWVVGSTNQKLIKYGTNGVYTGEFLDVPDINLDTESLETDGTFFYIQDRTEDKIFRYDTFGVFLGSFLVPDVANPRGIAFDGSHLRVLDISTGAYAYTGYAPFVGIPTAEIDISSGYPKYLKIKGGA